MAGNSPAEAVDNFIGPLRHAIQCVADTAFLVANRYDDSLDVPRAIMFGGGEQAQIRCRDDLVLDVAHYFQVVHVEGNAGPYRCRTSGYLYDFRHEDGPSVLSFHYHPDAGVKTPHIHTHQYTSPVNLSKIHIPTGRTTLEAVIRFAIVEFGAQPRRPDWEAVLDRSETDFNNWKEWG